jgi:hypothetical protein
MALDTRAREAVLAIDSPRVVTGHDAHRNAVVRIKNMGACEIGTTIKDGWVFRVIDDEPRGVLGNHWTDGIDCTVVLSGDTDTEMDGTVGHLKTGEILVQRGTIHH